jgi:hypothetical protein
MATASTRRLSGKRRGTRSGTGSTVKEKVYLTYPAHLIKKPLIYELGQRFTVRTNIRSASVSDTLGLVALEVEGRREEIDRGLAWLRAQGVTVEPIEKNVIE